MTRRGHLRLVGGTAIAGEPGTTFVAVRQAGRLHENPGSWLRLDGHLGPAWAPQRDQERVQRLVLERGAPSVPMAVMELPSERIVWTTEHESARRWVPTPEPEQMRLC